MQFLEKYDRKRGLYSNWFMSFNGFYSGNCVNKRLDTRTLSVWFNTYKIIFFRTKNQENETSPPQKKSPKIFSVVENFPGQLIPSNLINKFNSLQNELKLK